VTDLKTLRLASIQLTRPLLEQFLTYQRTLVAELDRTDSPAGAKWSGRFAFAHSHALMAAHLDAVTYGKVKALVGDWCARQGTIEQLRERLRLSEGRIAAAEAAGQPPDNKDLKVVERTTLELPALERQTSVEERYGAEAVALLSGVGAEIVRLHREVGRREGCSI
jgi:hypothetical protein